MKNTSLLQGAGLGAITSVPVLALSYLINRIAAGPILAFDLFDLSARILPGEIITLGIDSIVQLVQITGAGPTSEISKGIERTIALLIFVLLGALFGLVLVFLGRTRTEHLPIFGAASGILWSFVAILIQASLGSITTNPVWTIALTSLLFVAWGTLLGWFIQILPAVTEDSLDAPVSRRNFLTLVGGGSLAITLSSVWASNLVSSEKSPPVSGPAENIDLSLTEGPAVSPPDEVLSARIEAAPGTRSEITSNDDLYTIDINSFPPIKDPDAYRFEIAGLVENPITLTLDELRARPSITQAITLSCISNPVGGDLIGTSLWTGVSLKALLEEAVLKKDAKALFIEADDGFYETVALDVARDERTLLVYDMNGVPLPRKHGFPLRIYIPDRYGMKQPKWINKIQVINHEGRGYWVDRGWSQEARVNTTSVIDDVSLDETGDMVAIGGIAYSGAKGISKVEVQIDEGEWMETELRAPALSPLTWIQWRLDTTLAEGHHDVRVRAYDASGQLQETSERGARPDGATGLDHTTVSI